MSRAIIFPIFISFLFLSLYSSGQNETTKWYFGNSSGLDFMSNPPTVISNTNITMNFFGCTSMANTAGNLLFYANDLTVWNPAQQVMGSTVNNNIINGNHQSTIAVKQPGNSNIYFLFRQPGSTLCLAYSTIDMNLAAGMGSLTVLNTTISGTAILDNHVSAVRHCNGIDVWVLVHEQNSATFRAFLVTGGGVNPVPVVLSVGTIYGASDGYMKISRNGKKIALKVNFNGNQLGVYDFDSSTGIVSNELYIGTNYNSIEFSPDGTKLYSSRNTTVFPVTEIVQLDLCAGTTSAAVLGSQQTVGTSTASLFEMQLAPNGKIYMARLNQPYLGVINNPNVSGTGCNFADLGQSISPGTCGFNLPNFVSSSIINKAPPPPFTYTVSNTFGCQTASFTAVPNPTLCAAAAYSLLGQAWNFGDPASGSANTSTLVSTGHFFTSAGTYTVQLILYNSCGGGIDTLRQQVVVNQPCISVSSTSITCASLGSATVVSLVSGGPFTYTWLPTGQTNSVATSLSPGTYTIKVFDFTTNNTYTATTVFTSLIPLTGTLSVTPSITCNGASTGTANYTNLAGGSPNQNYLWSNGTLTYTAPNPNNLSAGTWSSIVTDALTGCTINNTFLITQPPAFTLNIVANTSTACVGNNIVLTATNAGGTPAYAYVWAAGPPTASYVVNQNKSGSYTYTLNSTDAFNCSTSKTIAVTFVPNPTITVANVSICPLQTGILNASGATSYTWSGGSVGSSFSDNPLVSQQYAVTGAAWDAFLLLLRALF